MRHVLFSPYTSKLKTALLIKDTGFLTNELISHYVEPLVSEGISRDSLIGFTLSYNAKKVSAAHKKEYLIDTLLPELDRLGITTLYCADSEYFKTLAGVTKADPNMGYVMDCAIEGYSHMKVTLGVNYQAMAYNPLVKSKLNLSLSTLIKHVKGSYVDPGCSIIHTAAYPQSLQEIADALEKLHQYPELTLDIEAFSLKFFKAGIGTISFSWDQHNGIGFACDYKATEPTEIQVWDVKDKKFKTRLAYGEQVDNPKVKELIKKFLIEYQGVLIYHNCGYDCKVLIYELWMRNLGDYKGMHEGISVLASKFEDTKLIAYLSTNNAVKNELSLKVLAQSFAGNYAEEDIKDIRMIPLPKLLEYNIVDTLSTWYVFNKYTPIMIAEQQQDLYLTMFKPSVKLLLQVELVGMPIDPGKVQEARKILEVIVAEHTTYLQNSALIADYHYTQIMDRVAADNLKLKKKVRTYEDLAHIKFNPGSDQQLQGLIYDYLGYEVIDVTDSKAPATGAKTLAKLINHARTDEHREMFEHLIGLGKADKVLTSFIPAFEQAQQLPDGSWRLYGNFNLGGTQSGRLSSSDPNLQNIR